MLSDPMDLHEVIIYYLLPRKGMQDTNTEIPAYLSPNSNSTKNCGRTGNRMSSMGEVSG